MSDIFETFKHFEKAKNLLEEFLRTLHELSYDLDTSWIGFPSYYEELVYFETNSDGVVIFTEYNDPFDTEMDESTRFQIPFEWFNINKDELYNIVNKSIIEEKIRYYKYEYDKADKSASIYLEEYENACKALIELKGFNEAN